MKVTDLPTPALLLDLEFLSRNAAIMDEIRKGTSMELYPHYKSHKCVEIAKLQLEWGAKGITCAKLSEAMDLCDAGIENIVIANQIVQQEKMGFLSDLAKRCRLTVCVDHAENVLALEKAMAAKDAHLNVLVEYDVGMHRCGVESYEEALVLANLIKSQTHLTFEGIQAYAGHISHEYDAQKRRNELIRIERDVAKLKIYLEAHGVDVNHVCGGSTGYAADKLKDTVYTQLQCGSYLFMDASFLPMDLPFYHALTVFATVLSVKKDRVILDCGVKSLAMDQEKPYFPDYPGAEAEFHEEHTILHIKDSTLRPGDRVYCIPGHCCTTTNSFAVVHVVKVDDVVAGFPITSRGCSQ